jgi:tetratricopeptide (TPR) repeat protein
VIKLSEDPDYLAYMQCYGDERYADAVGHLAKCLVRLKLANAADHASYVLQRMGQIYWLMGDSYNALRSFELAECEAPASLIAARAYVSFLADEMGDYELAAKKAEKHLWAYTGGKFDEESRIVFCTDYVAKLEEVRDFARSKLADL